MPTTINSSYETPQQIRADRDRLLALNKELRYALLGVSFWRLREDGSPCWCRLDDRTTDESTHLPGCRISRAVLAKGAQ